MSAHCHACGTAWHYSEVWDEDGAIAQVLVVRGGYASRDGEIRIAGSPS